MWLDVIVAIAAFWGAIVSTYAVYSSYRAQKPRVKVELSYNHLVNQSGKMDGPYLRASASKTGQVTVTLANFGMYLPRGGHLVSANPIAFQQLPHELAPGKRFDAFVDFEAVQQNLREQQYHGRVDLLPYYQSQAGDEFRGKQFNVDV